MSYIGSKATLSREWSSKGRKEDTRISRRVQDKEFTSEICPDGDTPPLEETEFPTPRIIFRRRKEKKQAGKECEARSGKQCYCVGCVADNKLYYEETQHQMARQARKVALAEVEKLLSIAAISEAKARKRFKQ